MGLLRGHGTQAGGSSECGTGGSSSTDGCQIVEGDKIPMTSQWPETTVHMPTGSTRTIEFTAIEGDWVMHCHMLHYVMTQMGHEFGNVIGIDTAGLNEKINNLVPGYMAMGQDGMGDMGAMGTGTDVAIESAGITLVKGDLRSIVSA